MNERHIVKVNNELGRKRTQPKQNKKAEETKQEAKEEKKDEPKEQPSAIVIFAW